MLFPPYHLFMPLSAINEKERRVMKAIVSRKFDLDETCLKVVKQLERVLTIPSDILQMSNESYHCHLTLTIRKSFFYLLCPFFLTFFFYRIL
jgi:hypothetical protein